MSSRVPAETRDEIIRLYHQEGLSMHEVGRRVFWSPNSVRRVLIANGTPPRARGETPFRKRTGIKLTPARMDVIHEMYRSGMSLSEIARREGVGRCSVARRLKADGVQLRSGSEATALHRRWYITEYGKDGLTDLQRRVLEVIEERPITTPELARRVRIPVYNVKGATSKLKRFGLITSRRTNTTGRPALYRRTRLPVLDVLDHALAPPPGRQINDTFLDITPFRALLDEAIGREERKGKFLAVSREGGDGSGGIPVLDVIAARMGVPQRVIWRWRNEQRTIALTTADRALQAFDGGVTIYDLWPHLAVDDELEAA